MSRRTWKGSFAAWGGTSRSRRRPARLSGEPETGPGRFARLTADLRAAVVTHRDLEVRPDPPGVRVRATPRPAEGDGDLGMAGAMPSDVGAVAPVIRPVLFLFWPGNTSVFNLTAN
jgi:hypothetical protein